MEYQLWTLVVAAPVPPAARSSKAAKIAHFLELTQADKALHKSLSAMSDQLRLLLARRLPNPALHPDLADEVATCQREALRQLRACMSWERVRPAYVEMLEDVYTDEELDGLIGFFSSPIGRAMVKKTPQLLTKSLSIGDSVAKDAQAEIDRLIEDVRRKLPPQ